MKIIDSMRIHLYLVSGWSRQCWWRCTIAHCSFHRSACLNSHSRTCPGTTQSFPLSLSIRSSMSYGSGVCSTNTEVDSWGDFGIFLPDTIATVAEQINEMTFYSLVLRRGLEVLSGEIRGQQPASPQGRSSGAQPLHEGLRQDDPPPEDTWSLPGHCWGSSHSLLGGHSRHSGVRGVASMVPAPGRLRWFLNLPSSWSDSVIRRRQSAQSFLLPSNKDQPKNLGQETAGMHVPRKLLLSGQSPHMLYKPDNFTYRIWINRVSCCCIICPWSF